MKEEKVIETIQTVESVPVLFDRNPRRGIEEAQELISAMSDKCTGEKFISIIQGKRYPKVEWWTTVGAVKGLFPYLISNIRLDRDDEICYEARVEVRNVLNGMAITSAEAICSNKERSWHTRDEYAIKSMAQTRATAKAYRIGLSFLAVMAGLEATPAEEVPAEGFGNSDKKEYPVYEKKNYAPVIVLGITDVQIEIEREKIKTYLIAASEGSEDGAKKRLWDLSGKYARPTNTTKNLYKQQIHGIYLELKNEIEMFDGKTTK